MLYLFISFIVIHFIYSHAFQEEGDPQGWRPLSLRRPCLPAAASGAKGEREVRRRAQRREGKGEERGGERGLGATAVPRRLSLLRIFLLPEAVGRAQGHRNFQKRTESQGGGSRGCRGGGCMSRAEKRNHQSRFLSYI